MHHTFLSHIMGDTPAGGDSWSCPPPSRQPVRSLSVTTKLLNKMRLISSVLIPIGTILGGGGKNENQGIYFSFGRKGVDFFRPPLARNYVLTLVPQGHLLTAAMA